MYGPSVMPYQPEGVWDVIRQVARWRTSDSAWLSRKLLMRSKSRNTLIAGLQRR